MNWGGDRTAVRAVATGCQSWVASATPIGRRRFTSPTPKREVGLPISCGAAFIGTKNYRHQGERVAFEVSLVKLSCPAVLQRRSATTDSMRTGSLAGRDTFPRKGVARKLGRRFPALPPLGNSPGPHRPRLRFHAPEHAVPSSACEERGWHAGYPGNFLANVEQYLVPRDFLDERNQSRHLRFV